jgi:hypothetical protein
MKFDMVKVVGVRVEFLVLEEKWRKNWAWPIKKNLE